MTDHQDDRPARPLITPPPGLVPDAAPAAPASDRRVGGPLIDAPPGLGDSGTVRMPASRRPVVLAPPSGHVDAPAAPATAPAFFPAIPGMAPALPTPSAPAPLSAPPAPAAAPPTAPAPAAPAPAAPAPLAATAPPRAPAESGVIVIELPDGRRLPVGGRMLLGRDPAELDGWRGAELIRLADPERSVSKTHAAIEPDEGALLVHDLASTNGTERETARGEVLPVAPGHPLRAEAGDVLHLGSFAIRLLAGV